MSNAGAPRNPPHLSVVPTVGDRNSGMLTRADVAKRIGASIATVRRFEGELLHPAEDPDGTHWFDPKEVTALAARRANEGKAKISNASSTKATRPRGEIAALVFERFEQRQSHAEIVMGLRVEPEIVRELFDQWCQGLTEGQLLKREPRVARERDIEHVTRTALEDLLGAIPERELTRISVGRWRGQWQTGEHGAEYAWIVELGGFQVSGPCTADEIVRRYGHGSYRVTAYGFDPAGLRWEVLIEEL
jgi:hypothetical protein